MLQILSHIANSIFQPSTQGPRPSSRGATSGAHPDQVGESAALKQSLLSILMSHAPDGRRVVSVIEFARTKEDIIQARPAVYDLLARNVGETRAQKLLAEIGLWESAKPLKDARND